MNSWAGEVSSADGKVTFSQKNEKKVSSLIQLLKAQSFMAGSEGCLG